MLANRRVTPNIKFAGTHLGTWLERDNVRKKCLAQEHNTMSPARAPPGPLDPELIALTTRPRSPHEVVEKMSKNYQNYLKTCLGGNG